jgi:hypothetical protein
MVREADAVVLASDVAQMLAQRGHDVRIPADGVRVVRLCALVIREFTDADRVNATAAAASASSLSRAASWHYPSRSSMLCATIAQP